MRILQNDRSVGITPADNVQLSDEKTYEEIITTEKHQVELVEKSNDLFSNLRRKNVITANENNYFRFNFKNATNLGKLYLLPKIHKGLCKVPGRPAISNFGTSTEKFSEILYHYLQPIMKQGESSIRDTGDFISKTYGYRRSPQGSYFSDSRCCGALSQCST